MSEKIETDNREIDACEMCGKCCKYDVPITLQDIDRISRKIGMNACQFFEKFIIPDRTTDKHLLLLKKKDDGYCLLFSENRTCTIHDSSPRACQFYNCKDRESSAFLIWKHEKSIEECRAILWEHSVSSLVTARYVQNNATIYNQDDFETAIQSIRGAIITKSTQKLKVSNLGTGHSFGIVYDCDSCKNRGECATETPVTLNDLKAIKDHLKIDWTHLMREHVSDEPSSIGTFKLRREKNCVFFGRDKYCSISAVKPMHCRFTCCPLKVTDPELRKCLYCSSGTIAEQFRHHVATIVTKRYVEEFGLTLNGEAIENAMSMITQFAEDENILNLFKKDVKDFRYFD